MLNLKQKLDVVKYALELITEKHKERVLSNLRILKSKRDYFNDDEWEFLMDNIDSKSNLFCYNCVNCKNCCCCMFCYDCSSCKKCYNQRDLSYEIGELDLDNILKNELIDSEFLSLFRKYAEENNYKL